jgi:hypothetical protein
MRRQPIFRKKPVHLPLGHVQVLLLAVPWVVKGHLKEAKTLLFEAFHLLLFFFSVFCMLLLIISLVMSLIYSLKARVKAEEGMRLRARGHKDGLVYLLLEKVKLFF